MKQKTFENMTSKVLYNILMSSSYNRLIVPTLRYVKRSVFVHCGNVILMSTEQKKGHVISRNSAVSAV